jgi:putative Holliday junction resolvase
MSQSKAVIALDVGEKRIGVAVSDGVVQIARPLAAVEVDGDEVRRIIGLIEQEHAEAIVVGFPRNQSGEPTAQTAIVETFAARLGESISTPILFQDESLTSVMAEERLRSFGRPYTKGDIDAEAATLILQDYLEAR